MAKMKITRVWWSFFYPYRVEWQDAYKLHHTQAISGPIEYHTTQGPYYVMRSSVQHFIEDLPRVGRLFKRKACVYQYHTGRLPFSLRSTADGIQLYRPPPPLYMARKADALMLKLTCA